MRTQDDLPYVFDDNGNCWRAYIFIERARAYNVLESPEQAFGIARAFGEFQQQLIDLPGERLHDTIPDFHNTPKRIEQLEEICKSYDSVYQSYAMQSGRELRVMVMPDKIDDVGAYKLAREIKERKFINTAKKILKFYLSEIQDKSCLAKKDLSEENQKDFERINVVVNIIFFTVFINYFGNE